MLLLNFVYSVTVLCCHCIHHFSAAMDFLHVDLQKYSSSLQQRYAF